MTVEIGNRILRASEIRPFIEARRKLDATRVPDFFNWIATNEAFPKAVVSTGMDGKLDEKYPTITLHGTWKDWNLVGVGDQEISSSYKIVVGMTKLGPVVETVGMHKLRDNNEEVLRESGAKRIKEKLMKDPERSLLQIIAYRIKETQMLNPNGEEIDIQSVLDKATELSPF